MIATSQPGDGTKTAPSPHRAITTTIPLAQRVITSTLVLQRETRQKDTTPMIWEPGTSLSSTARPLRVLVQRRNSGCAPTWQPTLMYALWRIGIGRALAPVNMATLLLLKRSGRLFMITGQT